MNRNMYKDFSGNDLEHRKTDKEIDYKAFFKYSIDAIVIFSGDFGQIIEINDAALELLGYNRNEITNLHGIDLLFPEEYERLKHYYEKNVYGFDALTFEVDIKSKDLNKIPVSVSIRKIPEIQDRYFLIVRDISRLKQTEEALKKEAFIFENLNDAVIITDLDGYIQSWNKAAESQFGYLRDEIINNFIGIIFGHHSLFNSFEDIKKEINNKSSWGGEIPIISKSNKQGISEVSIFPFRDSTGEHIAYVIIAKDITQRKQVEQEKRERDLMYRTLIESSSDAIYVLKNKKLLLVNSAWCKIFGYSEEEATSENFDIMSIIAPESKDFILRKFQSEDKNNTGYASYEMKGRTKDNRIIDLDVKVNKIIFGGAEVSQGIYRDITENKKAERELKESEEKFRKITEKSLVGIYIIQDGVFKYINPRLAEIFGYDVQEVINKKGPGDLTHPDDRKIVNNNVDRRLSGDIESIAYSFRGIKKDGVTIYVDVYGSAIKIGGKPAVVGTLMDTTERKISEKALKESEKKYRTIIEAANDAIFIVDIESRNIIDINKKSEKLTGRTRDELIGKSYLILHPPQYKERYSEIFTDAVVQKRNISPNEILLQSKNGDIVPIEISKSRYTLNGKEVIQGIFRDLRERKQIEEEIRKLSRAVEQSPSAIMITDTNGKIEYVNPYFSIVTGYASEEVIDKNPNILKSGETTSEKYSELWETISSGWEWRGEFHNKKKNGELYWEQASISPVRDDNGNITHYIAIKEDITFRKQIQQELVVAKERAEESDKMKSEFLSQMSHEIRTPLNVILSYNSFLQDELSGMVNEDIRLSFNSIESAGKRLLRTIDMILNLAALQKGGFEFKSEPVNLKNIIEGFAREFEFQAREKNLYLTIKFPQKEIIVDGDDYIVSEIFQNLIDNAIKYTLNGGVEVEISQLNDKKIKVDIKDTGIGISEMYIPRLFMPFTQEETGYTRKFEGNGLGLALVKNYADLLKAEIKVESEKGRGTTFSVLFNQV